MALLKRSMSQREILSMRKNRLLNWRITSKNAVILGLFGEQILQVNMIL
jgi:hypothetical protein